MPLVSFIWDETAQLIRICTSEHGLWGLTYYTNDIRNSMDADPLLKTVTAAVIRGQVYVQVRNLDLATDQHTWALLRAGRAILHVSLFVGPVLHIVEAILTKDLPQVAILAGS